MNKYFRIIISIIILTIILLIAAFVWPTMYRYDKYHQTIVRTNRFSGESEGLTDRGWVKMRPYKPSVAETPAPAPAPHVEYLGPLPEKLIPVRPDEIDIVKRPEQKDLKPITEYSDEELYKAAGIKPTKKSAK